MSNDIKKDIFDFLFMDFKEISEKLESTDKKVQFFIQIYVALIGASLTFIITFFGNYGKSDSNDFNTQIYLYIFSAFFILFIISQFILLYVLSGQKLHSDYVCKLNIIRNLILRNLGQSELFVEYYGYTKCFSPRKTGMNNWMIYLIMFIMILFILGGFWSIYNYTSNIGFYCIYIFVIIILLVINIIILVNHYHSIKDSVKKLNNNLNELINITSNEINEHL